MTEKHPVTFDCGTFGAKTVNASLSGGGDEPSRSLIERYHGLRGQWSTIWPLVLDAARSRLTVEEFGLSVDELLTDPNTTYEFEVYEPSDIDAGNWSFTIKRVASGREIIVPLVFSDREFAGGQVCDSGE